MASSEKTVKSADAFRTISEVSDILEVPQHVLRFWEGKFSQIKPMKRGGNRRYYRPEDLELLRAISHLLYTDGYTIKGVQKLLRENGVRATVNNHIAQNGAFQGEGGRPLPDLEPDLSEGDAPSEGDADGVALDESADPIAVEAAETIQPATEDEQPLLDLEEAAGESSPPIEQIAALGDATAVIDELKSIHAILTAS